LGLKNSIHRRDRRGRREKIRIEKIEIPEAFDTRKPTKFLSFHWVGGGDSKLEVSF
jgi:hypothetical protein